MNRWENITFFYSFVRTDNDSELTWVGDQKTGYQQGHYFRTAGTTKGLDGVSSIVGTYMSKNVADVLDAIGVYSGEANVNGRMIYCRYETLCDEAGEIVGAVVVGRSIEEMNDIVNKQSIRSFILQIVILAMISLGLGVIVSSLLSGLEKIKDYLRRIGEGTFPAEPLRVATGDELEQVSDSVNGMVDSLKEKERIGAELSVATDIQANMLPRIFPPFPEHGEFDLYATMDPAREVGGDFYDFFLLDESHLAVVIADVSGKGVPAALFMVIAKTLIKNQAQMGNSPAEVFTKVNQLLCEGNETGLFVTAWMAILDTKTGTLSFSNAGHNPPMLLHEGEFTFLRSKPGLVLAGMEGIRYRQQELKLSPGDKLFLYTDGVTEATDADETLYGEARLSAYLNAHREQSPQMLLAGLRKDMDTFVGEAEQFDDITMLLLEYRGQ